MKTFKKLFLVVAMSMVFVVSAFAESSFEFILNGKAGLSIGVPPKLLKDNARAKGELGLDAGVSAQFGRLHQLSRGFGISMLAEIGYSRDTFANSVDASSLGLAGGGRASFSYRFDSLQIGLLPKFNFGKFAIGIGGGIKIPLGGGKETVQIDSEKESIKLSRSDIKNLINPMIIGYVKGTLGYSIFLTESFAFNIGLYLEYDIMKARLIPIGDKKEFYGSFDIGLELGLRFWKKGLIKFARLLKFYKAGGELSSSVFYFVNSSKLKAVKDFLSIFNFFPTTLL